MFDNLLRKSVCFIKDQSNTCIKAGLISDCVKISNRNLIICNCNNNSSTAISQDVFIGFGFPGTCWANAGHHFVLAVNEILEDMIKELISDQSGAIIVDVTIINEVIIMAYFDVTC